MSARPAITAAPGPRYTAEQQAAIDDRSGSRLLAANAGSGKTAVMVERFAAAVLEDGVPVHAILALTFTEKAAGELLDRVRRRFAAAGELERAREAEGAWVGTIHGFCARVLRAHPFAAGLDPGFAVLDEAASGRLARAAYDAAVEEWAAAAGRPAVDLLAAYGPALADAVLAVHAELRSRGQSRPRLPVPPAVPPPDTAELLEAHRAAAALLAGAPGGVRVDAARQALEACAAALEGVGGATPLPSALDAGKLGNGAKILGDPACQAYREAWQAYRAACADHHAREALVLVAGLLDRFADAYAGAKRARAALDFEDLQLMVRDLLAGDAALRGRWSERFALIMVDEFQDTNRLQLDILGMLERSNGFTVGDEFQSIYGFRHADVTVFRERAQALGPGGVRRLRANFRSHPELLDVLNAAFSPVLGPRFEALVAGGVPRPEPDGAPRLFDPDRVDVDPRGPRVEVLVTDTGGWDDADDAALGLALPGVPAWRRGEARQVAARLRELVDHGRRAGDVVVLVRAAASLRLLEQALEEAGLPTYVVGGRGYWSQEQVRDGLAYLSALANPLDETALLTVLASPFCGAGADALVLAAQAGRAAGGTWRAMRAGVDGLPPADAERLGRFTELFERERAQAERGPAEVLLDRAISASGYDVAVLARPGGQRRLANLRKLMRLAREYERAEGRDLRGFVRFAAGQDLSQAREGEAALEGEGLDAVRLMTIHRAKGLEFPVVCVADLGRQGPTARPTVLVGGDGEVGLRFKALGAPGAVPALAYEDLWARREAADAEEERRLLYVAMTRAEDHLILSGGYDLARAPQPRPGGPPMDWVLPAMLGDSPAGRVSAVPPGDVGLVEREWEGRPARIAVRRNGPELLGRLRATAPGRAEAAPPAAGAAPERWEAGSPAFAPDPAAVPAPPAAVPAPTPVVPVPTAAALRPEMGRLSYSSLGSYARCGYRFYLQRVLGLPDAAPPSVAGALPAEGLDPRLRGTLVHEALELIDLRSPSGPSPAAWRAHAALHGVELTDAEVEDLDGLVRAFGASELRSRLARASSVRREAPFALTLEPGPAAPLLHGVVDVLAREAGGTALVVDYKTDRLDGADPVELADAGYGTQRAAYALAALAEGAPRVDVAHLFLEAPDRPAVASFDARDQPALRERLLELAAGVLAGSFPVAAEPHHGLCATCPGRRALCSHPEALTLRPLEAVQASAGWRAGSGGPS